LIFYDTRSNAGKLLYLKLSIPNEEKLSAFSLNQKQHEYYGSV